MSSEAQKGALRVLANYGRLFATLVMGLFVVRILFDAVGDDAFGLISFLGSTVGLAAMLRDIVNRSLIRELGEATRTDGFPVVFNSSLALMVIVGLMTLGMFGVLAWALRFFDKIPPELLSASRLFIAAKALETFFGVLFSPYFNSYLVTERMVSYNLWRVADRASLIIAAGALLALGIDDPAYGLICFGFIAAGIVMLVQVAAAVVMICLDRRYMPDPRLASLEKMRAICLVSGWNAAVVAATSAHARIDALLIFIWLGPFGGRLFGVAFQLTSYIRQIAVGMTHGLDAVATRITVTTDGEPIQRLVYHSTRFNAAVVLPAMVGMAVLARPLIEVWIGDRLSDPSTEIPMIVTMIRVFAVGVAARGIADGWVSILYGAGHIRRFAPVIVLGAVANPTVAIAAWLILPAGMDYLIPAMAFSVVLLTVHLGLLPLSAAGSLNLRPAQLYAPMWRPMVSTAVTLPALFAPLKWIETWTLTSLLAVMVGYAMLSGVVSLFVVLTPGERRRMLCALTRKRRANG